MIVTASDNVHDSSLFLTVNWKSLIVIFHLLVAMNQRKPCCRGQIPVNQLLIIKHGWPYITMNVHEQEWVSIQPALSNVWICMTKRRHYTIYPESRAPYPWHPWARWRRDYGVRFSYAPSFSLEDHFKVADDVRRDNESREREREWSITMEGFPPLKRAGGGGGCWPHACTKTEAPWVLFLRPLGCFWSSLQPAFRVVEVMAIYRFF